MSDWIQDAIKSAETLLHPHEEELKNKEYSNIFDEEHGGHQYVDLVCEGGGMLGIALVGYTYILERAGLRFRSIAGTSAGAINALLLAATDEDETTHRKSDKLLSYMGRKDFFEFVDGDGTKKNIKAVKKIITKALAGERLGLLMNPFALKKCFNNIKKTQGLNKGDNFTNWIDDILTGEAADTTKLLKLKINTFPPLKKRTATGSSNVRIKENYGQLKIVSTDITTESRAIFPEHAELYFQKSEDINPAKYVRASMSIPVFFSPFCSESPSKDLNLWKTIRNIAPQDFPDGIPPEKIFFVDGGMMSNFPFDLLHTPKGKPELPTFGVKLETDFRYQKFNGFLGYLGAIVNSSRHAIDNKYNERFLNDYKALVTEIYIDKSISWLDFNMSRKHKIKLFRHGEDEAIKFLLKFDWKAYRASR